MVEKVGIKVFLPAGVCSCSQTAFLSRVNEVVRKYWKDVEYREDSAASETAKALEVGYRGVLVGNVLLRGTPTVAQIETALLSQIAPNEG